MAMRTKRDREVARRGASVLRHSRTIPNGKEGQTCFPVRNGNQGLTFFPIRSETFGQTFRLIVAWDPTEPVATRPLVLQRQGGWNFFYTHDGNKNVSELVFFQQANGIAAHYEYAPFGAVTATSRSTPVTAYDFREYNPFRFSSEYADDALGLVYYNYRHYNLGDGRWLCRGPLEENGGVAIYTFCNNRFILCDYLGLGCFDDYLNSFSDTRFGKFTMCMGDCISDNDPIENAIEKILFQLTTGVYPKSLVAGLPDKLGKHHEASLVRATSKGKSSSFTSLGSIVAMLIKDPKTKQILRRAVDAATRINTAYGFYMLQVEAACAGACCASEEYGNSSDLFLIIDVNPLINQLVEGISNALQ